MAKTSKRRIGLALGSGSARGMSHIGVIRELEQLGIKPDIVCGTSIGAIVGAFYVCGKLAELEEWVGQLDKWSIAKMMDISFIAGGGFIEGKNLTSFLETHLGDPLIEELPLPFATVATDMETGQEIWFKSGPVIKAVRASITLPVLLTPVQYDDQWLLDGGLVNPVPVSVCRALGAHMVIAVNLNGDLVKKHFTAAQPEVPPAVNTEASLLEKLAARFEDNSVLAAFSRETPERPGMFDVLASFIDIMQDRITRSRMAGDPPDVMLVPRLGDVGLLEFDKSAESIAAGRRCVQGAQEQLMDYLGV